MHGRRSTLLSAAVGALALLLHGSLLPGTAAAFSGGAPDGVAGEPPANQTCTQCHTDFPLNSGDGFLTLHGVPQVVAPGQTYEMSLELGDPGQLRYGFELTVIDDLGQSAGELEVVDPLTTWLSDNAWPMPDYLKQTSEGSFPGTPVPVAWAVRWIADSAEPVTFHAAGNAANFDGAPSGDYIYGGQWVAGGAVPIEVTTWGAIKSVFGATGPGR